MSARRLGLDHIDLYYLHTPTMTDAPFEEIINTLAAMRQDGLIRHIGLSNVSADQLRTAMSITDIAAVTVHYNVAVRLGAAVRQVAQDAGIVFSPGTRAPSPEAMRAGRSTPRSIRSPRSTTPLLSRSPSPGSCTAPSRRCPSPAPPAPSTSRRTSPPLTSH